MTHEPGVRSAKRKSHEPLSDTRPSPPLRTDSAAADPAALSQLHRDTLSQPAILSLQRTIGNRAVTRLIHGSVQRDSPPTAAKPGEKQRIRVDLAIKIFEANAGFHQQETAPLDKADFDSSMETWYEKVVKAEECIDRDLQGDPVLKKRLQEAYIKANRALMKRAVASLGKNEDDLFRENNGRIPMWAWQTAYHQQAGFSTPLTDNQTPDPLTGEVNVTINGIQVTIKPDGTDPSLSHPHTGIHFDLGASYGDFAYDGKKKVTSFTPPPTPKAEVQTMWDSKSKPGMSSGYGRGTTAEDKSGGKVTPHSTSLGFHEGNHGLEFIDFITKNPPPTFKGKVGQTIEAFKKARSDYKKDWAAYNKKILAASGDKVDEVGLTLTQYTKTHPGHKH
ncbi:MAG: hypothetical protein K8J31_24195 [Anaerolineae bacterium]|nr:hypothetical protein [Anaerolineae bacterium]